jgi:hypothetical protein
MTLPEALGEFRPKGDISLGLVKMTYIDNKTTREHKNTMILKPESPILIHAW